MRRVITLATFSLLAALVPTFGVETPAPATATATVPSTAMAQTSPDQTLLRARKTLRQKGRVDHVVDGDTVNVRLKKSGRVISVRMIGIDTPEVYPTVECGGPEASSWLKKRLAVGTKVKLVSDPTQDQKDQYGRALRYVIRQKGGTDMNRAQVLRGNATLFVWNGNPFTRVGKYRAAQRKAKAARRGIWGKC